MRTLVQKHPYMSVDSRSVRGVHLPLHCTVKIEQRTFKQHLYVLVGMELVLKGKRHYSCKLGISSKSLSAKIRIINKISEDLIACVLQLLDSLRST